MRILIVIIILLNFITLNGQIQRFSIGVDFAPMYVKPDWSTLLNQKINTRFGGNIGYNIKGNYTIRIGLYKESWDYRYEGITCGVDSLTNSQVCFNNKSNIRLRWWSIPVFNEWYFWKKRLKFIVAPNILLEKQAYDISLLSGLGYNLTLQNYGRVKIDFLYQNNKIDFFGRKGKPFTDIFILNFGYDYSF